SGCGTCAVTRGILLVTLNLCSFPIHTKKKIIPMTTMLFYDKIVPLNRDQHRKLHLRPSESKARFSANTHYVPVAGTEFYQAARDYPLLFPKNSGNGPIALLGMREGENLFLEEDGAWQEGVYIPAFIR